MSEYPAGTFIKTEAGFFYVFSKDRRYRFSTTRVLESWTPPFIINTTESNRAVQRLKIAGKMKFRDGSLLYSHASGKMYLVSEKKLRHITNPDWLSFLGLTRADGVWVSTAEINLHEMGEPLN